MSKKIVYTPNRVIDADGIADGATISVYQTGGTTPVTIYLDKDLTTPAPNPYTVPAGAEVPRFWHNFDGDIRIRVVSDSGQVVQDDDPYDLSITEASLGRTEGTPGSDLVGVVGGGKLSDYIVFISANAFGVIPDTDLDANGYPNNPVDQADNLQNAIDYAYSLGVYKVVVKGRGAVVLGSTVLVPFGMTLDFGSARASNATEYEEVTRVMPLKTGEFNTAVSNTTVTVQNDATCEDGYLFFLNVNPANTGTWIRQYPNVGSGGIENISIDGSPTNGISAFYFAGSHTFQNIRHKKVATLIRKPSVYTDSVTIKKIYGSTRANADDYLINLPGTGDSLVIHDVACGYTGDQTGISKGVYVVSVRGSHFFGLINGIHEFRNTHGKAEGCHIEGGQMIVDQGAMTLADNVLFNGEGALVPIVVRNSNAGNGDSGTAVLSNNVFNHWQQSFSDLEGWANTEVLDIEVQNTNMDLTIGTGNRRVSSFSGNLSKQAIMAPLIGSGGTVYSKWKNVAPMLAQNGCHISNGDVLQTGTTRGVQTWNGLTVATFTAPFGPGFQAPTGTYYYSADLLADTKRMIGRTPSTNAEVFISATNGNRQMPTMNVAYGPNTPRGGFTIRVYRGTATGSYTHYADIPALQVVQMIDDGDSINGVAWQERAAGAKDVVNNNGLNGPTSYTNGTLKLTGSATPNAPSTGAWEPLDQVFSAGNTHASYICTAAGSPGTWAKLGIIGAEKAANSTSTYVAPSGGTTTDTQARASLAQLAADVADLKTKLKAAGLQTN